MRRRVILDVDTGVDDALAIMLAVRSPELEVLGITTVSGNVPVAQCTANTLLTLEVLDAPNVPVVSGAAAPLAREAFTAAEVHGSDGLGNVTARYPTPLRQATQGAVEFLLEMIRRFPGELTLVATGPLTNVAMAIQQDREAMRRCARDHGHGGRHPGAGQRGTHDGVQLCRGPGSSGDRPGSGVAHQARSPGCDGAGRPVPRGSGRGEEESASSRRSSAT